MNRFSFRSLIAVSLFSTILYSSGLCWAGVPLVSTASSGAGKGEINTMVCLNRNQNACSTVHVAGGNKLTLTLNTPTPHALELRIPPGYTVSGCSSIEDGICRFSLAPHQSITLTMTDTTINTATDTATDAVTDHVLQNSLDAVATPGQM